GADALPAAAARRFEQPLAGVGQGIGREARVRRQEPAARQEPEQLARVAHAAQRARWVAKELPVAGQLGHHARMVLQATAVDDGVVCELPRHLQDRRRGVPATTLPQRVRLAQALLVEIAEVVDGDDRRAGAHGRLGEGAGRETGDQDPHSSPNWRRTSSAPATWRWSSTEPRLSRRRIASTTFRCGPPASPSAISAAPCAASLTFDEKPPSGRTGLAPSRRRATASATAGTRPPRPAISTSRASGTPTPP